MKERLNSEQADGRSGPVTGGLADGDGLKVDLHAFAIEGTGAEGPLEESEDKFRSLTEKANVGIYLIQDGIFQYVNPKFAEMHGYSTEELAGKKGPADTISQADWPLADESMAKRLSGEVRDVRFKMKVRKKAGAYMAVEVYGSGTLYRGKPAIMGTLIDITERERAERALLESESKFRTVFEQSGDAHLLIEDATCIDCNRMALSMLGLEHKNELIGKSIGHISPLYQRDGALSSEKSLKMINTALDRGTNRFEWTAKKANGEEVTAEIVLTAIGQNGARILHAAMRDITIRKQAEAAIREKEDLYASLVEQSSDGIFVLYPDTGRLREGNDRFLQMLGYIKGDIPDLTVYDFIAADTESIRENIRAIMEKGYHVVGLRQYKRKDGSFLDVEVSASSIRYADTVLIMVNVRDVTERKRAEDELRMQAQVIDQIHDAVISTDGKGYVKSWNRGAERMYGYAREEVIGKHVSFLYPEGQYEYIRTDILPKALEKGNHEGEMRMVKKSGDDIFVHLSLSLVTDSAGDITSIIGSHIDITEHRKLEEQLRHAHKMQAIGQLAGGIAHDFNNVLTAILGYASLLQMRLKDNPTMKGYVDQIFTASDRAASLTQSLLLFGRKQLVSLRPVDVNKIIRKCEKLLSHLISEDVELRTELFDRELTVLADAVQVEQILMNLATNARDAMPQGGILTIGTDVVQLDSKFVKGHGYGKPGSYALIAVSDTGMGMKKETAERIFEPFYTTKEVGKGTGLGLSIVYGIVKQHNGYIIVESKLRKGTSFKVYIPLTKQAANRDQTREVLPLLERGGETILVAEDNPEVRTLMGEILRQFGYTVIEAEHGEEAIEKFKKAKENITLIILDVVMPKANGKEVYEEVKKIDPDVKVLFASGYTADMINTKGIKERGANFIRKPVQAQDILLKVREILDKNKKSL